MLKAMPSSIATMGSIWVITEKPCNARWLYRLPHHQVDALTQPSHTDPTLQDSSRVVFLITLIDVPQSTIALANSLRLLTRWLFPY